MTSQSPPAIDITRHLLRNIDFQRPAFTKLTPERRARFLSEVAILLQGPVRAYEHVKVQRDRNLDVFLEALGKMPHRWSPGNDYQGGEVRQVLYGEIEVKLEGHNPMPMPKFESGYFRGSRGLGLVYPSREGFCTHYNLTALFPRPM